MLKKIKYLTGKELQLLIPMANINLDEILNGKSMDIKKPKYYNLLCDSSKIENSQVKFLIEDIFDQLMFDDYDIYLKLKNKIIELNENDIRKSSIVDSFIILYEKLLYESKFEFPNIRQVQKCLLEQSLKIQTKQENYEKCIILKENLEEV
jgi:hypothetical protein